MSAGAAAVHEGPAVLQEMPPPSAGIAPRARPPSGLSNPPSAFAACPPSAPASAPPSAPASAPPSAFESGPPSAPASVPASAPLTQTPARHDRPKPGAPQSASAMQPQMPRLARQAGLSLVQSEVWAGEHSVHSPARFPLVWHPGLSALGQAKAAFAPRSAAHGTQTIVLGSHTGARGSLQSACLVHPTQAPVLGSQLGVLLPQKVRLVGVHCTQRPRMGSTWPHSGAPGRSEHWPSSEHGLHSPPTSHTGFGLPHCALELQWSQVCVGMVQLWVPQSAFETHCTH